MDALTLQQQIFLGLIFVWSGFVRSGLGFGGSVLSLPFFLLVVDDPLLVLPPIAVHLLIFSSWIFVRNARASTSGLAGTVDWKTLGWAMKIMIIPKLIGVIGLLTIPADLVSGIILLIIAFYAVTYILNKPIESQNPYVEKGLLALGGYVSGTSLTGAPLILAIFARRVPKAQLRDTLFVLWFILVLIKMASFIAAGVDLQLESQVWMFPCALAGHLIGERLHARLVESETPIFFQVLGATLLVVAGIGIWDIGGRLLG